MNFITDEQLAEWGWEEFNRRQILEEELKNLKLELSSLKAKIDSGIIAPGELEEATTGEHKTNTPPTVELDSEAHAAYIRFSTQQVTRTSVIENDKVTVTADFAANGELIGVELVGVGVSDFLISSLLQAEEELKNLKLELSSLKAKIDSGIIVKFKGDKLVWFPFPNTGELDGCGKWIKNI